MEGRFNADSGTHEPEDKCIVMDLLAAANVGDKDLVNRLCQDPNTDINREDQNGQTALMIAARKGFVGCLCTIIQNVNIRLNGKDATCQTALMSAVIQCQVECVRLLLGKPEIDVNIKDNNGMTSLLLAAMNGHHECVQLLLNAEQIDINSKDDFSRNALMLAALHGNEQCLQLLFDTGRMDINGRDIDERTAFMLATGNNHIRCVQYLLDSGQIDLNLWDKNKTTAFMLAAKSGHLECMQLLLNSGKVDINIRDKDKMSAFMLAVENNFLQCVQLLLNSGQIDANRKNFNGMSALMLAIENRYIECVKLLLDSGQVDVNSQNYNNMNALMLAAKNGFIECVRLLLDSALVDIDYWYQSSPPFKLAIENGHLECAQLLFDSGKVDINQRDRSKMTALMLAGKNGHIPCIQWLLDSGQIDLNRKDGNKMNTFMLAVENGHVECVQFLLSSEKVNINRKNDKFMSAVLLAAKKGHIKCVRLLLDSGVPINKKDEFGRNAFMLAAKHGHLECVQYLFNTGKIAVNGTDLDGRTAFQLAALEGHTECVRWLFDSGLVIINSKAYGRKTAFMLAASNGHTNCVKFLFETGQVDINDRDSNDNTAFMLAVCNGHIECLQLLHNTGLVDASRKRGDGCSALTLAAWRYQIKCYQWLLQTGQIKDIDLNPILYKYDDDGESYESEHVIERAAQDGNLQCIRSMFDITTLVEVLDEDVSVASHHNNLDDTQDSTLFKPMESGKWFHYISDIPWKRPYFFNSDLQGKSVLKLVVACGQARCVTCFLLTGQAVPLGENLECDHDMVDKDYVFSLGMLKVNYWDFGCSCKESSQFEYCVNRITPNLSTIVDNNRYECIDYLLQIARIHFHTLVHTFRNHFIKTNEISLVLYQKALSIIKDYHQVDRFLNMMCRGVHPGYCINILLSAYLCWVKDRAFEFGLGRVESAIGNATRNNNKRCLELLTQHVNLTMAIVNPLYVKHYKRILWRKQKFNAYDDLEFFVYLQAFIKAGLFLWRWYPALTCYADERLIVRELVIQGYNPDYFEYNTVTATNPHATPLQHAFLIEDVGLVKYLVANLYFTSLDLRTFQSKRWLRRALPSSRSRGSESKDLKVLHRQLFRKPWRLEAICLVKISTLLTAKKREDDMMELQDEMPKELELRLGFKNPIRLLSHEQWHRIPVDFPLNGGGVSWLDEKNMANNT